MEVFKLVAAWHKMYCLLALAHNVIQQHLQFHKDYLLEQILHLD